MFWWALAATSTACLQGELRFRAKETLGHYSWVCCDNDVYTEPKGSFATTDIFQAVSNDTIFYDSQCGIPLFQLGKRDLVNWTASSIAHGWPSFRDSEVYSFENLQVTDSGSVVSRCGTHLGHTLPDSHTLYSGSHNRAPGERYIINLLCMSGYEGKTGTAPAPAVAKVTKKVLYPDRGEAVSFGKRLTVAAIFAYLLF
jgi:peptide methionine sulfoxide reductase MsrB